jgi:hypothetical protein
MRLLKSDQTEMRVLEETKPEGDMGLMSVEPEAVECEVWTDLDGNPCAWTPVGSGVISIEIGGDDNTPLEVYRALKDEERKAKTAEERIAELEAMVAQLAAQLVD